jgi:peptidyl-prolyl cis-trans isomerase B (cyclophilin B)
VIQGGNSEEEKPQQQRFLIGQHTLKPESNPNHIHTRGSLAMSRSYSNNPDKLSSSYDFYIVTGRKIGDVELAQIESEKQLSYTPDQKRMYKSIGGTPHLDGEHTVFGRVIRGMEVADRIALTPRDDSDWPLEKLAIKMRLAD